MTVNELLVEIGAPLVRWTKTAFKTVVVKTVEVYRCQ